MTSRAENTLHVMTTAPVGGLILKNAVPTIITMMVTAFYNTADTFFVSQLGTSASGAVGIIFSLMTMIQAGGFMIGMGSGSITSRALGSKDMNRAQTVVSTAIVFAFSSGSLLSILGTIFIERLVRSLGATPTILPYALSYARYIIYACPFMMCSFVMNNLLRFQGKAAFSMIGMATGGLLNMALDPLFIFVFNLGIKGAALATLISQITGFLILSSMFIFRRSAVDFHFKAVSRRISVYFDIITTGLPSFFRQGLASLSTVLMNTGAAEYGALMTGFALSSAQTADAAVAGMSISNRILMLLLSLALGFGQGFQPVCGINLGAKEYGRVKKAIAFLLKITSSVMTFCGIFVFIFAPQIAHAFRDDEAVIAVASRALRLSCLVLPLHSMIFSTNMLLQVAGEKLRAVTLSSMRQGIVFVPVILLLPRIFAASGLEPILAVNMTPALSDFITALVSIPFMWGFIKKLNDRQQ